MDDSQNRKTFKRKNEIRKMSIWKHYSKVYYYENKKIKYFDF